MWDRLASTVDKAQTLRACEAASPHLHGCTGTSRHTGSLCLAKSCGYVRFHVPLGSRLEAPVYGRSTVSLRHRVRGLWGDPFPSVPQTLVTREGWRGGGVW